MFKSFSTCLLWCVTSSIGWAGTTYYVAPNGDDKNSGTSERPFATPQKAADIVNPGDTVIVRDGVYTGGGAGWHSTVNLSRSGTEQQPILIKAEHKWRAVLDGRGNRTGFAWLVYASYVAIQDFEMKDYASHGVAIQRGSHITVKGNHIHHIGNIHDPGKNGLDGCYDDAKCKHVTYDGNVIHHIGRSGPPIRLNQDHGIYTCGDHNRIYNNLFYHCDSGYSIQVAGYDTVDDLMISNNTFAWGANRPHIVLWRGHENQKINNCTIQNNIFYEPLAGTYAIDLFSANACHNIAIKNNLFYGSRARGLYDASLPADVTARDNIVGQDPHFVNASKEPYDFRLKAGSPAIGKAVSDLAPDHDFDGKPRPAGKACDMGPFETQE